MSLKEDYHVHCNYNDHSDPGLNIPSAVHQAQEAGLKVLAFAEHVRRTSDWIPKYLDEIASVEGRSIKVIPGFEGKILPDGSIDCPERYAEEYFLIASFHTTYGDKNNWLALLKKAIQNPLVDVIGHLAAESSFALEDKEMDDIASLVVDNDKTIELNVKYHRPPPEWLSIFKAKGVRFHLGSDAHSLQEIGRFERISDLISLVENTPSSSVRWEPR